MSDIVKLIPNFISIFRIICVPFFLVSLQNNYRVFAFVILLLAALSDFFDGYLSRKLNAESRLGALLDPIADKLFLNSVLWGMCLFNRPTLVNYILAISLTLRDLILLCGGLFVVVKKISINIAPVYLSKICTTLMFVYVILSILLNNNAFLNYLGCTTVLLIVITFVVYLKRFLKNYKH